ncbi:MAG: hypothetical protein Q4G49_05755 [Paracoccus sp. (in: a-proteobacteria)]|nr:hypothetical protein [Paracoccus sp. (in: a-proteobacteria)]
MIDPARQSDEKLLQAWRDTRPRGDVTTLTHRAAMRVLPVWCADMGGDRLALPIVRWNLALGASRSGADGSIEAADAAYAALAATRSGFAVFDAAYANPVRGAYAALIEDDDGTAHNHRIAVAEANDLDSRSAHAAVSAAEDAAYRASDTLERAFSAVRTDTQIRDAGGDLFTAPLWPGENPLAAKWDAARPILQGIPGGAFWIDWYQRALDGSPQNWPLLRDVALIDEDIWIMGGAALDHAIAMHVERYRLRDEVARLRRELLAAQDGIANPQTRSHNNPPELVDTQPEIVRQVTVILANLAEAEEELEKPQPSPPVLARIGNAIWAAVKAVTRYCAGLADVAAKESAKTVGGTGTKLLLGGGAAYLVGQSEAVGKLAEALIQFAGKLP